MYVGFVVVSCFFRICSDLYMASVVTLYTFFAVSIHDLSTCIHDLLFMTDTFSISLQTNRLNPTM